MKTKQFHLTLWATNKETGYRFIVCVHPEDFLLIMGEFKNLYFDITEGYY